MTTITPEMKFYRPEIAIVLQRCGSISAVMTSNPKYEGVPVKIIDYLTDGVEPHMLELIDQRDGTSTVAISYVDWIIKAPISF